MSEIRVVRESVEDGEIKFTASLFEVENAVTAFFDEEGSMKLGTLAIGIPQFNRPSCISSVLLGDRNALITKVLAEQLVRAFNKIALVSSHLAVIQENRTNTLLIRLAKKLCDKAQSQSLNTG
ncbi:MAG: hypothetical protein NWF13_04500 [Candidatus Bathyarchaeota archaeon]|nr:hypothetical protein [Candidatus Bathyarchaeota archaeon]